MIEVKQKKNPHIAKRRPIESDFHFVPVVDGKEWSHFAETEDIALLIGLGIKYDGVNSQFAKMACRMLNIESKWAD